MKTIAKTAARVFSLGLPLVLTLALSPGAWATGEEIREQDAEKKQTKTEEKAEQKKDGESASVERDPAACRNQTRATFNTVEEIRAYSGLAGDLWKPPAEPQPPVTWQEVVPPQEPR